MPAPRTLRRHAPSSKNLIAGFALACALAGSPASAQQPFNTVMTKLAEGKQVVGGTVSSAVHRTVRGSGDHHRIGPPGSEYQGKIPIR